MSEQGPAAPTSGSEGAAAPATPSASQTTPTPDGLQGLSLTFIDEQPAVSEHAINQAQEQAASNGQRDKSGTVFDPLIHGTDSDGKPRKNANGNFAAKRGRKPGTAAGPAPAFKAPEGAPNAGTSQATQPTAAQAKEQLARQGGRGAANLLIMMGVGLGGQEWLPRIHKETGMNEALMLETAFGDFFAAKGYGDLPPGWALTAAIGMYMVPRFGMPQTRTRLGKVKDWFARKYAQWKLKKAGVKARVISGEENVAE